MSEANTENCNLGYGHKLSNRSVPIFAVNEFFLEANGPIGLIFLGMRNPPRKKQIEGPCWFCLGSPEVEKHLVVTVGETLYVALPKGPLTDGHFMIVPIAHEESGVQV